MTDEIEIARRAVASPHWRWMPGMLARYGNGEAWYRLTDGDGYGMPFKHRPPNPRDAWPDLTDPATVGCLVALVREALEPRRGSDYIASTMHTGSGWGVCARFGSEGLAAIVPPTYDTEAEALVAALEAAPVGGAS